MRYRNVDERAGTVVTYSDLNGGSSGNNSIVVHDCGTLGKFKEMYDIVTPGYRRRRLKGDVITNPCTSRSEVWYNSINGVATAAFNPNPDGSIFLQFRDGPQLTYMLENNPSYGKLAPKRLFSVEEITRFTEIAATRAWSDALGEETQGLVFLAELHKTLHLLRHPTENLYKFLKKVLRKKREDRRAFVQTLTLGQYIAQEWLAYRYGVRPLLKDLHDIVKAACKDKFAGLKHSRGSYSDKREETVRVVYPHGDIDTTFDTVATHSVKIKCGLLHRAELSAPDFFGLSAMQVPGAVWELIPFSFVVDWFFNVGDWVQGLVASIGVPIKGSYTTITEDLTISRNVIGSVLARHTDSSGLTRQMTGAETLIVKEYSRTTSVLKPSLTSKVTISQNPFRDLRLLDTLALIAQILSKR